jgi:pimeloyl-ACP methyl ester carboxylesterase
VSGVVLMHGLGNSGSIFRPLTGHLRPDVAVHVPEMPWSSGRMPQWRHETDSAARVGEVLDAVAGPVGVVVAHSYATIPLLELLSRRALAGEPAGVSALVLVNPFFRPRVEDFPWELMASLLQTFPRTMAQGIGVQSPRPIDAEVLDIMARHLCDRVGPYGWLRFLDGYLQTPLLRTDLITVPSTVVGGELDVTAPAAEARALAGALPAGELRLAPVGHFPMVEQPGWLAEIVHEALAEHPAALDLNPMTATAGA